MNLALKTSREIHRSTAIFLFLFCGSIPEGREFSKA